MICQFCQRDVDRCTHRKLHEEIHQLRVLEAARQKIDLPGVIMVRSLISHRDQSPRIDIQVGEIHTQMDTDAAMDVALHIIECCNGSYADGFIFHFMQDKVGLDQERAAMIIEDFRVYREKLATDFKAFQEGHKGETS